MDTINDPKLLHYQDMRESEAMMPYEEQYSSQQSALALPFVDAVLLPYHQHHFPHYPPPVHPSHFSSPAQNNHHTYTYNNTYCISSIILSALSVILLFHHLPIIHANGSTVRNIIIMFAACILFVLFF
jgi:hypothetical protein